MNQNEKRYLVTRIREIRDSKAVEINEELRKTEAAFPKLSNNDKKALVITALLTPNTQKAHDAISRMGKHEPASPGAYHYNEIVFVWEWPEEVKTNNLDIVFASFKIIKIKIPVLLPGTPPL